MRKIQTWLLGLTVCLMCVSPLLTGCEEKGTAEKAGEAIDKAVEDVGDAVKEATE